MGRLPQRFILFVVVTLSSIGFLENAGAKGKLDISANVFNFKANSLTNSVSKESLGDYQIDYRFPLNPNFEIGIGYSLLLTQTVSGDMSFGPDFEFIAYPLTFPYTIFYTSDNLNLYAKDTFRPFIGLSFHQRQFASIQNSYAGFGILAGTEYWFKNDLGFKIEFRLLSLSGPQNSTADQTDIGIGYILEF